MRTFRAPGVLVLAAFMLQAETPDGQYVRIYNLIQQADILSGTGGNDQARQKYLDAQAELKTLRKTHPGWNESVVEYRLNYIAEKLDPLTQNDKRAAQPVAGRETGAPSATGESAGLVELLQDQNRQLAADKELLQARLKEALTAQPAAVDPRELARAEEKIRTLRKEVEVLRANLERVLEEKLKESRLRRDTELTAKTRAIEKELAEARTIAHTNAAMVLALQTALKAAQRERVEVETRLTNQLSVLSTRLDAVEARKTPYTPEELALFRPRELDPLSAGAGSDRESFHALPAAAGSLVAEAGRAFSARRYEEAEKKYSQALRFDEKNVAVLANLAAVQIERNRPAEAESNLRRALTADPTDAFSLSLLGLLKVRQRKYDEALDVLGRAARIDPQNALTFQYLGVALVEKGLREPAESAFRRAIKLAPGNGDAHHHLAVVYASQRPPSLELARWHYQKALETGHPKDPGLERILSAKKPAAELK